jgi:hypothetical protein
MNALRSAAKNLRRLSDRQVGGVSFAWLPGRQDDLGCAASDPLKLVVGQLDRDLQPFAHVASLFTLGPSSSAERGSRPLALFAGRVDRRLKTHPRPVVFGAPRQELRPSGRRSDAQPVSSSMRPYGGSSARPE